MKFYLKKCLIIFFCMSSVCTIDASSKIKRSSHDKKTALQPDNKSGKKAPAPAQEKVVAAKDEDFSQNPLEVLRKLAALPIDQLRKPENQEKIAQAHMQISEAISMIDESRPTAQAHAEASQMAAELKDVVKEIRAKLLPSKQKD